MNGFELVCGGRPAPRPMTAQRLAAFLAFQERPVQRSYVAGKLWPDSSEERALASVRSALWRANHPAIPLIRAVDSRLGLCPGVRVDAREAADRAQRMIEEGDDRSCDPEPPAALASGELLPDWYEDWLIIERERLRQLRLHALEALAGRLVAASRYGEAVQAALLAIAAEPLRESAHAALIRVHIAENNPCEALREYELYRDLIARQLGLRPSAQLTGLVARFGARNGRVTQPRDAFLGA
jgi:DNA-binding SARP family transcriptional activator